MPEKKKVEEVAYNTQEERLQAAKRLAQDMNKKYGVDVIHTGQQEESWKKQSTGIKEVDDLLGGGIPIGTFSCFWGAPKSAKTTLCYELAAQAQKDGKIVYWIALEPFDRDRATLFGIDLDKLIIGHFPVAEQSLDSIIDFSKKKLADVIILDSLHSLAPKNEMEEKNGDSKSTENDTMALLARKLSQFFRMAVDAVKRGNVAVLLIGQTRTNVGFIAFERLSGGNALHHYCRIICHMRRGQSADAPTKKLKDEKTGKSETIVTGFDSVFKLDKVQITGCKAELSELHIPYLFESGYRETLEPTTSKPPIQEPVVEAVKVEQTTEGTMVTPKQRGRPKKQ